MGYPPSCVSEPYPLQGGRNNRDYLLSTCGWCHASMLPRSRNLILQRDLRTPTRQACLRHGTFLTLTLLCSNPPARLVGQEPAAVCESSKVLICWMSLHYEVDSGPLLARATAEDAHPTMPRGPSGARVNRQSPALIPPDTQRPDCKQRPPGRSNVHSGRCVRPPSIPRPGLLVCGVLILSLEPSGQEPALSDYWIPDASGR